MNVSAAHVKGAFLEPSMDALALNLGQCYRLQNRTPQCDSLADHLARIQADSPTERFHLEQATGLVVVVAAENESEGAVEQAIAGAADTLARELRGVELNGASGVLKAKGIARHLRGPLNVLCDVDDGAVSGYSGSEILHAAFAVGDVLRAVPSRQLFSPSVEHELRGRLFRKLHDLHSSAAPSMGKRPAADAPGSGGPDGPGATLSSSGDRSV
jgi:hypothetical protein